MNKGEDKVEMSTPDIVSDRKPEPEAKRHSDARWHDIGYKSRQAVQNAIRQQDPQHDGYPGRELPQT